jgi:hypothetical protein
MRMLRFENQQQKKGETVAWEVMRPAESRMPR